MLGWTNEECEISGDDGRTDKKLGGIVCYKMQIRINKCERKEPSKESL